MTDNQITGLTGAKDHPLTKGFICNKGREHLERHLSPDRLRTPLKRVGDQWISIDYDEAEGMIIEHLEGCDNSQIIHYNDAGYGGLAKEVDNLFFSCLGGVVSPRGSLCWAAGIQATKDTFSDVLSADVGELENAETIVLWGRNPSDTNLHLANRIVAEKKKGKRIILIDPIKTASARLTTDHLAIRPNTDHLLALGILKYLDNRGEIDNQWIHDHSNGWDKIPFDSQMLQLSEVSRLTGLEETQIIDLARAYQSTAVMTYIGYGLQRYRTGGNVVRCINALSFATRNFGGKGRGVNYAHKGFSKGINTYADRFEKVHSTFVMSKFGEYVLANDIRMIMVTKANPLVQLPNLELVKKAFSSIDFKVGIDLFMTDTMMACDLVLPATSIFEEEDVVLTSMYSPHLQYSEKVIDNNQIKGEFEFFRSLADKINLPDYPLISKEAYLEDAISDVLSKHGMTFEEFKSKGWITEKAQIQYENMKRFNFICQLLLPLEDQEYPMRLITPHHRNSLHSQGFRTHYDIPKVHMSQRVYETLVMSEKVEVISRNGHLVGTAIVSEIPDNLIMIYEGYWHHSGSVNVLTTDAYSDIGDQAAYYDTFVKVRGILNGNDV
jgi:anaerobic selenocysteine-containing dehydrogenase